MKLRFQRPLRHAQGLRGFLSGQALDLAQQPGRPQGRGKNLKVTLNEPLQLGLRTQFLGVGSPVTEVLCQSQFILLTTLTVQGGDRIGTLAAQPHQRGVNNNTG